MAVESKEREDGKRMKRKGGGSAKVARSSRELVAYDSMLPGGVAYLGQDRWSVTPRISDISYQIASQDVQMDVVARWGRFLNSVGEGMGIQVTVMTRTLDPESAVQGLAMDVKGDGLDALREDFDRHVRRKLSGQSSGTVCDKYLTLTLAEQDAQRAVATLNRAALRAIAQLRSVGGCRGSKLNRAERLKVLHRVLRPGVRFTFDEDAFSRSHGLCTKDCVAPYAIDTSDRRRVKLCSGTREMWHQCLMVRDFPEWLSDPCAPQAVGPVERHRVRQVPDVDPCGAGRPAGRSHAQPSGLAGHRTIALRGRVPWLQTQPRGTAQGIAPGAAPRRAFHVRRGCVLPFARPVHEGLRGPICHRHKRPASGQAVLGHARDVASVPDGA